MLFALLFKYSKNLLIEIESLSTLMAQQVFFWPEEVVIVLG